MFWTLVKNWKLVMKKIDIKILLGDISDTWDVLASSYKVSHSKHPPLNSGEVLKKTVFSFFLIFFQFCPNSKKKSIFFVKNLAKKCKKIDVFDFCPETHDYKIFIFYKGSNSGIFSKKKKKKNMKIRAKTKIWFFFCLFSRPIMRFLYIL